MNPITAAIIGSALTYASEEMGLAIRNAAYSPNIKERLDHSCALFDPAGNLIAQAEHIPVHLGSLPWGLRRTLAWLRTRDCALAPGDQWVVNDPYIAGTHLNDVTVIRPIFMADVLVAFAANKAHHADVGGAAPGSMPPDARDLFSEGLIVPPIRLVIAGRIDDGVVALFQANSRTPAARAGDLRAQIAGNVIGERRVIELVERYGAEVFARSAEHARHTSELRMRAALRALPDGAVTVVDFLEDAAGDPTIRLQLALQKRGDRVALDYTGTSAQVALPLNAVYGVTLSGVYYVLRALTDPTIPMNEGVFVPITVGVPEGTLLNPRRPAPVSGGNVETSMRNADLVLSAFALIAPGRVPAQSGGSMNNVIIGGTDDDGQSWSFYETNGCGMGARPVSDGIDGIHAHMTNTLNTPIEAIERDFPLRIVRYEFAAETGGDGRYRGGCGIVRSLELARGTATASLIAERHRLAPQGLAGGEPAQLGSHHLRRGDARRALPAKTTFAFQRGDIIEVQTAGGGGYGPADARDRVARDRDGRDGLADQVPAASRAKGGGMELTATAPVRTPVVRTTLRIAGLGTYVPEHRITNDELSAIIDTNDEWIRRRTGIRERRKSRDNEFTSDLCMGAVAALIETGASLDAVDYVIAATISPDYQFPSVAAVVQDRLGLRNVGAIDISAACAGFAYALDLADALLSTGRARNVLVVAGETLTKITDYRDRAMCILFGDGAGAALVTSDDGGGSGIVARRLNSDGAAGKHLFLTALNKEIAEIVEPEHYMRQNGRAVYEWVVTHVSSGISELLASANVRPDEIDWFIPHSANMRMIESVCERSGIAAEKTLTSMQWFGNTSSASIPLALAPAIADGRVKRGQLVLLYGFGGGLVEAGLLLRW